VFLDIWLQRQQARRAATAGTVKKDHAEVPVVMIPARQYRDRGRGHQRGAYDFIESPFKSGPADSVATRRWRRRA